ncbi:asparagine synthase (glutamine-hydrolyzing) [Nocardia sp. NPDC005978]|uniref:asparagine synthase (glutamine-hydrolyzing) n=1 Tax=Nocardia sp. NPDC005978 TaxID=3156725 RepID=UPI0033A47BD8
MVAVVRDNGIDAQALESALRALAHRGPDGSGHWIAPDRRVALGHTRLAVRDVAGGAQPIRSTDDRCVAVVNGELYHSAELRSELRSRGHEFTTRGDSELVLHAWREWGPAMLPRLHGEFALIVWDARRRTLFAARDRFGIKPLVWARHADAVLLASRIAGLSALGLPIAWNHDSLWQSTGLQYAPPGETLFAGAHVLPAGHWLTVRDGAIDIRQYWDLDYPVDPAPIADPATATREFRSRLTTAVTERLDADVPVAFQLSGGLDSSAVLAAATRHRGPQDAFTLSFADAAGYDEHPLAAATADHLGARLHTVAVTDRELAESFPAAVLHAESTCVNTHAAAKLRLHAAVRAAGFKVALTGEGADEILFGYPHLRADLRGSLGGLTATNTASAGLMLPDGDGLPLDHVRRELGFVPTWLAAKASFGRRVRDLLHPEWSARFADHDIGRTVLADFDIRARLTGRGPVEQSSYLWTKLALEGYILRALGDGLEMANGVEGRLPFLDTALVEHALALPTSFKIRDGVEKWILREAVRDLLPADVVTGEKHPFLGPPIGPHMRELARSVLTDPSVRALGFFDAARIDDLLKRWEVTDIAYRKLLDPVILFFTSVGILHTGLGMTA